MNQSINSKGFLSVIGRMLIIILLLCAVILSGKFTDLMNGPGLVFIFIGGFALTGFLATLMGFVQALFGFSSRGIQEIAIAITFILSSCFVALVGMMLVGNPLEDCSFKVGKGQKPLTLSRIAWFVFPLVTLILLFLTFVMVVTPIQKG